MGKGHSGSLSVAGATKILKHMAHHKTKSKELSDMPVVTDEKFGAYIYKK
tara:strand:- start:437 stop:586 length:150 start_codon:yes stop_codon:yes gene_type:complete